VRLKVMETPLFARLVTQRSVARVPVAEVIKRHPAEIVLSAFLRMSEQAPFYVYTTFALAYIKDHLGQAQSVGLGAVSVAAAVELFLIPASGHVSDRLGRRRVYGTGAVLMIAVAFPFFLLLNTKTVGLIILGVVIIAIPHALQYGPQAAYIAESFPTRLGYAGSGLGYQLASLIAGGPAPLLATWMLASFGWQAISVYIVACAVLTITAMVFLPDRSKADLSATTMVTANTPLARQ
jgi:MFS family permease